VKAVADEMGRVRPTTRVADARRGVLIFQARIVKNLSGEIDQQMLVLYFHSKYRD
jgi:hypothetical protein